MLSLLFRVSKAAISALIPEVCEAIRQCLEDYIKFQGRFHFHHYVENWLRLLPHLDPQLPEEIPVKKKDIVQEWSVRTLYTDVVRERTSPTFTVSDNRTHYKIRWGIPAPSHISMLFVLHVHDHPHHQPTVWFGQQCCMLDEMNGHVLDPPASLYIPRRRGWNGLTCSCGYLIAMWKCHVLYTVKLFYSVLVLKIQWLLFCMYDCRCLMQTSGRKSEKASLNDGTFLGAVEQ
ncbi:hypothetical protein PR048_027308 [Dryococelus australis]|uniref:Uncharacterized protein n=1 Tax=Dryococelus australis TaxID=614101 RepID=A0ABQ9GF42_9NEOP|nr:hypothetical protein PR048_027308 [Dryococelus australis]